MDRRRFVLLAALAGCAPGLDVAPTSQVTCANDSECPNGFLCRAAIGRCVAQTDIDSSAPVLVKESVRIDPGIVRRGSDFEVRFRADRPLGRPPTLTVIDPNGAPVTIAFTHVMSSNDEHVFRATPTGGEPEKSCAVRATMVDRSGNTTSDVALGNVRFDFTPPAFGAAAVMASPAVISRSTLIRLSVTFDEPLAEPPQLTLAVATTTAAPSFVPPMSSDQTSAMFDQFGKAALADGDADLRVRAVDEAGNVALLVAPAVLTVDTVAPSIVHADTATVTIDPAQRPQVTPLALGPGGTATFVFDVDEPLAGTPMASIIAPLSGPCTVSDAGQKRFRASCSLPSGGMASGEATITVHMLDRAGNAATRIVPIPLAIDTTAPALPQPGCLVHHRVPWGDALGPPRFFVAGPCAAVPGTRPWIVVYDGPSIATASELGRGRANADGSVDPISLAAADVAAVYAVLVDDAGNATASFAVDDSVFVATLSQPAARPNPNVALAVPAIGAALDGDLAHATVVVPGQTLDAPDTATLDVRSDPTWTLRAPATSISPPGRTNFAMAYDAVRGRVVLFGGRGADRVLNDTWIYDGNKWFEIAGPSPPPRAEHALAYDAQRDRIVLYGGCGLAETDRFADTWTFDGVAWHQETPNASPGALRAHAMVYDSSRGNVVLFGGNDAVGDRDATWIWNGLTWSAPSVAAPKPPAGTHSALSDTLGTGLVVLYGGVGSAGPYNDLWAWNGVGWRKATTIGTRPALANLPSIAWDERAQELVAPADGTWSFRFLQTTPNLVGQWVRDDGVVRNCAELVFDRAHDRVVLTGGATNTSCVSPAAGTLRNETAVRIREQWFDATPSATTPPPSDKHIAAYDPLRHRAVIVGGDLPAPWLSDVKLTPACPSPPCTGVFVPPAPQRFRHGFVYAAGMSALSAVGYGVMFGGLGGGNDLIGFGAFGAATCGSDGVHCWTTLTFGGPVSARSGHAMTYDSGRNVVILHGGDSGSTSLSDSYEWTGGAWVTRNPPLGVSGATGPTGFDRHALAYDESRAATVMFGGFQRPNGVCDGGSPASPTCNELWEHAQHAECASPSVPCWKKIDVATRPTPRHSHSLHYDKDNRRVILFGGASATNTQNGELWSWNGAAWRLLTPHGASPSARSAHAFYYDELQRKSVLIDGIDHKGDAWDLELDPDRRPGFVTSFALKDAIGARSLQRLVVTAAARGRGFTTAPSGDGNLVTGAALWLWNARAGGWQSVATNTADLSDPPATLTFIANDPAPYLDADGQVSVVVTSRQATGNGQDVATASLDYLAISADLR